MSNSSEIEADAGEASKNKDINLIVLAAQLWTHFGQTDDYKTLDTPYYGGFQIKDMELQAKLRSAGTEILKTVGKKIMSGNFNLTAISFPIKCMSPKSLLQRVPDIQKCFSFYLNYAASLKNDPVERLKAVIASTIAFLWKNHSFDKPLNPVLGETYQAKCADGATLFCE